MKVSHPAVHALLLLSGLCLAAVTACAQGTAFTYQGRLSNGGNPASGSYDLQFTLYDSSSAGGIVAGPLTNAATAVSNGLFTVILNFGGSPFSAGAPRWLAIDVRTNGAANFVPLNPRQALTPTPYAITAGNLDGAGLQPNSVNSNKLDAATRGLLGSGEANTISNLGGGFPLALAKSGVTLPLRTIIATGGINVSTDAFSLNINGPTTNGFLTSADLQRPTNARPSTAVVFDANTNLTSGFTFILTNATTADFQSALDNGGTIWIQNGDYTLANLTIKKPVRIFGNQATLHFTAGLTNFMLDTGTNGLGGPFVMEDLNLDGGEYQAYTTFFFLTNGSIEPFYNSHWANRSGIRVESSGGGTIRNCRFYGFPGNGALLINTNSADAHKASRISFENNFCFLNFIGCFAVGPYYDTAGYNNNPEAGWVFASAEYSRLTGNQCFHNYIGISVPAGNAFVSDNALTDNFIGLLVGSAPNAAHGIYSVNTINHNTVAIWAESNNGGIYAGNSVLADAAVIFNHVTDVQFSGNYIGNTALIFTNGTTGVIKNNFFLGNWGVDLPTNIASGVIVSGNHSENGTTDHSLVAALEKGYSVIPNTNSAPASPVVAAWMVVTNQANGKAYAVPLSNWP